jgi:hypothetical protein
LFGRVARLPHDLLHYSYRDLDDFFVKFNRYTTLAAQTMVEQKRVAPPGSLIALRAGYGFFQRYFLRLGFLDGYPGFCHAFLACCYGFTKYTKFREMRLCRK